MTRSSLDRRAVLGGVAAAAFAPLAGCAPRAPDLDVAIVGGGVAGVYAAWRLRREAPHLNVALFEMSNRIGGRLRSVSFPQAPHLFGDVGGMRFLDAQKHVSGLVKHLQLARRPYPIVGPTNRLTLRGKSFSYAQAGTPPNLYGYNIAPADQSPASDLYMRGIERIVPGARTMIPAKWKAMRLTFRHKGRLLKDWAAWALYTDAFNSEELAFVQDSGGYDDFVLHNTGLDALDFQFFDDDESKPFYAVAGGYQHLPLTLVAEAKRLGAKLATNMRLVSLHTPENGSGIFRLTFAGTDGRTTAVTAKRVVLALPRRSLELIDDFPARKGFADLVEAVHPVPACKSLTLYPRPWWTDEGSIGGRSITDMPARQFYALGAEPQRGPLDAASGHGVLMQYCDANSVEFWREIAPKPKAADCGFQWLGAGSQLVQEIHREAGLTFGMTPPAPLAGCFQDWTADPFGGGWHNWASGVDGFATAERIMQPIKDLFICGEAYAPVEQSWVEGAVERSETMLQRYFGLKKPNWLA
jgi:monoamine oxidase